jgi:hypothetical protein
METSVAETDARTKPALIVRPDVLATTDRWETRG